MTARTINPNHEYYESSTYEDKRAKTFGSLKAAPRGPDSVVSETFEKLPPKNVGKARNVTNKITACARKHNPLNYKSNIPFGFGQNEKSSPFIGFKPSIRVVGNFGYDQTNTLNIKTSGELTSTNTGGLKQNVKF